MKPAVKVAFASGADNLNARLVARMKELYPELPLYVVSDLPPDDRSLPWIPWKLGRSFAENRVRCLAALECRDIRLSARLLSPHAPLRGMRLMALLLKPPAFIAFDADLNGIMLRPRYLAAIAQHVLWRAKGELLQTVRAARDADWSVLAMAAAARAAAWVRGMNRHQPPPCPLPERATEPGISLVIPSRNGKDLLAAQLPGITMDLAGRGEIIVVDNGSDDGAAEYLREQWPALRVEISAEPLSFAAAVNRGIARARYSHVCLLNNDMLIEPGFFAALLKPFDTVPGLFCSSAQIRFPAGVRREETGKTVMVQPTPEDFPVRCVEAFAGEDHSYVLYGSGGCSLYDSQKLRALGGVDEAYSPAYVEDLDLGYRAWQRGWPTVYADSAVVEHRHRATTSRYYTEEQLEQILETNYLKFICRAVSDRALYRRLWAAAVERLRLRVAHPAAQAALRHAPAIALANAAPRASESESAILALTNGDVAVFPGCAPSGRPRVLVASPYLPYPLSHGGAVRMFNLMRRGACEFDQALVAFADELAPPPRELLDLCVEVVLVRRAGAHSLPFRGRPDVVEEFDSAAFREALRLTIRKWRPAVAQLEFTQMAQYATACAPARTILVEHDVTVDLCEQLLHLDGDWETQRQLDLWRKFETEAWDMVSRIVVMSEKDRKSVGRSNAVTLANGVDLEYFRPSVTEPEEGRLLFIGSFAHLPSLLALEFFLVRVWPLLKRSTLHVVAGSNHLHHLERQRSRVRLDLAQPGIEVEGFVSDVRPAYGRAAVVIAPLVASAGTSIKVLEAMAMGKAIVSSPAGVNGLDLRPDEDFLLAYSGEQMAAAIERLLEDAGERRRLETAARRRVERDFGWDEVARGQARLYHDLIREAH